MPTSTVEQLRHQILARHEEIASLIRQYPVDHLVLENLQAANERDLRAMRNLQTVGAAPLPHRPVNAYIPRAFAH